MMAHGQHGYNNISHSYYTRVASILYKCGAILENNDFIESAERYFKWIKEECILENGFIKNLKFRSNEKSSISHAMMYVIEGLMEYSILSKKEIFKDIAEKFLVKITESTKDSIIPVSRYDDNYNALTNEVCTTGVANT